MAAPPNNGREGNSKEHSAYNDPIEEQSSGREVPVLSMGLGHRSELGSERLDLQSEDQVVPPTGIAQQPMNSSSSEVEGRCSQNRHTDRTMKVLYFRIIPYTL